MTTERDHLDQAIDSVARRLVRVEDDSRLAAQIVASLPERRHWLAGLTWRLAAIAALAGASTIVLQRSNEGSTGVLRTGEQVLSAQNAAPFAELVLGVAPHPALRTEIVRSTFVEPPLNLRRTPSDHERALASLALAPLAEDAPSDDGFLSVEPLSIDDLPLASELLSLPE
jgi:hypothetical protein